MPGTLLFPRHDLSLAEMTAEEILPVVHLWAEQYAEIGALPEIGYVQIFENRGEVMGCSNPHPHGQIWASAHLPGEPEKEQQRQRDYLHAHDRCLLCDYLAQELRDGERIVCANRHFVALVPFWACWPFETMVLPRRHLGALPALADDERLALAEIIHHLSARYDNLFHTPFPYSTGWHQAPTDAQPHEEWHLHAHYYPPLLRSATVKKFMVGFEMLATRNATSPRKPPRIDCAAYRKCIISTGSQSKLTRTDTDLHGHERLHSA